MTEFVHFIVAKSRHGWAVNVEADLLSEHVRLEDALAEAEMLSAEAQADGVPAKVVDLSEAEA